MLNSKQKVFKKIIDKWLDEYGQALNHWKMSKRTAGIQQAEENKRLALLALETIY